MQVKPMGPRINGQTPFVHDPNTSDFWLVVLVVGEIGLLIVLRRYFGSRAHGG